MDIVTMILWLSVAIQLLAAIMALRLIPLSGRSMAWMLISTVFVLMAARRAVSLLYEAGVIHDSSGILPMIEPLALVISLVLVIALHLIKGIFEDHNRVVRSLNEQMTELRRFQRLMVGRELRMKELKEEIAKLKGKPPGNFSAEQEDSDT